jgi:hypothetical protein
MADAMNPRDVNASPNATEECRAYSGVHNKSIEIIVLSGDEESVTVRWGNDDDTPSPAQTFPVTYIDGEWRIDGLGPDGTYSMSQTPECPMPVLGDSYVGVWSNYTKTPAYDQPEKQFTITKIYPKPLAVDVQWEMVIDGKPSIAEDINMEITHTENGEWFVAGLWNGSYIISESGAILSCRSPPSTPEYEPHTTFF